MKFIKSQFLFGMLLAFLAFSCQKEASTPTPDVPVVKKSTTISEPVSRFDLDVKVENGMLHFDNSNAFFAAMESVSDNEKSYVSDEVLNDWENRIGFKSMRHKFFLIENELLAAENDPSLRASFESKYGDAIFNSEGRIETPVKNSILASFLDEEGRVMINGDLHYFSFEHQIVVLGGAESKLTTAKQTMTTNQDQGVYVINNTTYEADQIKLREDECGETLCRAESTYDEGNKRLIIKYQLRVIPTPNYVNSVIVNWTLTKSSLDEMWSEKKGLFNSWKSHEDNISLYGDYEASGGTVPGHIDELFYIIKTKASKITHQSQTFSINTTGLTLPTFMSPGNYHYLWGSGENLNPNHPHTEDLFCP